MSGLGLTINTGAAPIRIINLSKPELEELKSHIDDGVNLNAAALKDELLRVIGTLLSNRLPGTDEKRLILNLQSYKYALEHNKDNIQAIRSALLGEFMSLIAAQAGGRRRRRRQTKRKTRKYGRK